MAGGCDGWRVLAGWRVGVIDGGCWMGVATNGTEKEFVLSG